MTDMALIVPSRGRPQNIARLYQALIDTESQVHLYVGIDADDDKKQDYVDLAIDKDITLVISPERKRFGPTLNDIALLVADQYEYIAWMGDDHLPVTKNWDKRYIEELDKFRIGMVYGNDLVMGEKIATQLAFTAKAVKALGYAVPPGFIHLYIDNYFMQLFSSFHAMTYLPDVIIQHLHPVAGKAEEDLTYKEANSKENWTNDKKRFHEYLESELKIDAQKLMEAIS